MLKKKSGAAFGIAALCQEPIMGFPRFAVRFCIYVHAQKNNYAWETNRRAATARARARARAKSTRMRRFRHTYFLYAHAQTFLSARAQEKTRPVNVKTFEDFPTIYKKISRFLKRFPDFSKISQRFPRFLEDFQDFLKISKISQRFPRFLQDFGISSGISRFP